MLGLPKQPSPSPEAAADLRKGCFIWSKASVISNEKFNASLLEHLILNKRKQRTDNKSNSITKNSWKLVAQTFPTTSSHNYQHISPAHDCIYNLVANGSYMRKYVYILWQQNLYHANDVKHLMQWLWMC